MNSLACLIIMGRIQKIPSYSKSSHLYSLSGRNILFHLHFRYVMLHYGKTDWFTSSSHQSWEHYSSGSRPSERLSFDCCQAVILTVACHISQPELVDLLNTFQRVMHSVLSTRIVLHVRSADEQVIKDNLGGSSVGGTQRISSMNFAANDISTRGATYLSESTSFSHAMEPLEERTTEQPSVERGSRWLFFR
jgi:hypothetical protein